MRDRSRSWTQRQLPEGRKGVFAVCAGMLLVIAAALILLHGSGQRHNSSHHESVSVSRPVVLAPIPATTTPTITTTTTSVSTATRKRQSSTTRKRIAKQDPQDRPGTAAAKRAARALKAHLALQHLPYQHGDVTITLTGALRDGKAVLTVIAPTLAQAKVGYRRFLARYHDAGRAYRPRFIARRKVAQRG